MKKLIIIAALALATALTGCEYDGSSPTLVGQVKVSHRETTGQNSYMTYYDYDDNARLSSERQTLNGTTEIYEDTNYEYNISATPRTISFIRTTRVPALAEYKHVLTYREGSSTTLVANEVFLRGAGGSETVPVEYYRMTPDPMLPDLRKAKEEQLKGGVLTVKDNFEYSENVLTYDKTVTDPAVGGTPVKMAVKETYADSSRKIPSSFETRADGKMVEYQVFLFEGSNIAGYRIWRGADIVVEGPNTVTGGVLVEEEGNIEVRSTSDVRTETWTVTRYDAQGKNPVVTEVEEISMVRSFGGNN